MNTSSIRSEVDGATYELVNYQWDFGDTGSSDVSTDVNPVYVFSKADENTVKLIIETNAGCIDSILTEVTTFPRKELNFSLDSVCLGNDINIMNNSSPSDLTVDYSWNFGDGLTSRNESPQKVYQTTGVFEIELKTLTDKGCLDSMSQNVVIYELPVAQFSIHDTCENSTVLLTNTSSILGNSVLSFNWNWDDNTNSSDKFPIKSFEEFGSYDVGLVVTSEHQCKDSTVQKVAIFGSPVVDFNVESVCKGEEAAFLNSTSISDGSGLNYAWDFDLGVITSSLKSPRQEYDTSGIFDITLYVNTVEGCKDQLTKQLEIFELPDIDLEENIGTCAGSYTLDVSNSGIEFLWSDGSENATLEVSNSGSYSVLVTDLNNCQNRANTTVSLNSQFTPSLGDDRAACDNLTLDGGNLGSKSYAWSTGEDTRFINVSATGEYSVLITDQNDCVGADTIIINVNSSPIVELGNKRSFCEKKSVLIDAANPGSTYEWSTGENTQTVELDSSGNYTVKVTDLNACSTSDNVIIEVYSLPVITLGDDALVCDTITLKTEENWPSILWSTGSVSNAIKVSESGEYWLSVTDTNLCTTLDTIQISVASSPSVSLGEDVKICSQKNIVLDAGNTGFSYKWVTNATSQTIEVNSSGLYFVEVTSDEECIGLDSVNVFVEPTVQINLGDDQILCNNQEITLDAGNVGGKYSWMSNAGILDDNQTIVVSDSGLYWVEVTTRAGCKGQDTVHVFVINQELKPEFVAVSSLIIGDTVQFVNVSEPEELSYSWNFDDGVSSTAEDPTHMFFTDGEFNVSLTVSNGVCTETIVKTINVFIPRLEDSVVVYPTLYNQIISASLFPNPTHDNLSVHVNLETIGEVVMVLYSIEGRKIFASSSEEKEFKTVLDVSELPKGVYLLHVHIANDSKVLRFVKI